jgi:hypothetical protein
MGELGLGNVQQADPVWKRPGPRGSSRPGRVSSPRHPSRVLGAFREWVRKTLHRFGVPAGINSVKMGLAPMELSLAEL